MLGFSTEEVREMFTYYKNMGTLPADCDIEAAARANLELLDGIGGGL